MNLSAIKQRKKNFKPGKGIVNVATKKKWINPFLKDVAAQVSGLITVLIFLVTLWIFFFLSSESLDHNQTKKTKT